MKKSITSAVAALTIATTIFAGANDLPIQKVDRNKQSHIIVAMDRGGLNNYTCLPLYSKNISQFETLFSKQMVKKLRVKSITFITFDEQINMIGTAHERNPNKTYRIAKELFEKTKDNMQFDTKEFAKDVIGAINYTLMLAQQYNSSDEVIILFFSNLRESIQTKQQLKSMNNINLPDNVHMQIYSSSGLSCLSGTTTASQSLQAEQSYKKFFKSKIDGDLNIFTIYGEKK